MKYGEAKWGGEPKQFLCKSANGIDVFIDPNSTNIGVHTVENPELMDLVKEGLSQSMVSGENVALEIDMGRIIGITNCIETTEDDEVIFARRIGRTSYSRFVKNREPEETNILAIILHKKLRGYNLWSAWCGKLVPTKRDITGKMRTIEGFWDNHALVYDPKIIEPGSERQSRPVVE